VRRIGMHAWGRCRAVCHPRCSGGPARARSALPVLRLVAALGIAAAAAAGCAGTAEVVPAHLDSGHSAIGRSCSTRPGWAAITLTDTAPQPVVTVELGARVVVTVPRWGWGRATDVHVARGGILREECTVLLRGGGRRTVFLAAGPGSTWVSATVEPASGVLMPSWGGEVIVRGTRG
jgi:hypothetical protein